MSLRTKIQKFLTDRQQYLDSYALEENLDQYPSDLLEEKDVELAFDCGLSQGARSENKSIQKGIMSLLDMYLKEEEIE